MIIALAVCARGDNVLPRLRRRVYRDSPQRVADEVLSTLTEGTRFYVLFQPRPDSLRQTAMVTPSRNAQIRETNQFKVSASVASPHQVITAHIMSLMQRGFTRLFAQGQIIELQSPDDYTLRI